MSGSNAPQSSLSANNVNSPARLLAASEPASDGGTVSVLKRPAPTTGEASGATVEAPPAETQSPVATESPAPLTSAQADDPVAPLTSSVPPADPAVPADPAAGTSPDQNASTTSLPWGAAAPGDNRVSSRRTVRSPSPGVLPSGIASRHVNAPATASTATEASPVSASTLASAAIPFLRVDVMGPKAVTLGEEAPFQVRVVNQTDLETKGVTVRVVIPRTVQVLGTDGGENKAGLGPETADTSTIVWTIDRLPGRGTAPLFLRLQPTTNATFDLGVDWSVQPPASSARIEVKEPRLEVAVTGAREVVFGESKVFAIVVSNPGTGDAKNVTVNVTMGSEKSDPLNVGTVLAGGSKTFEFEVTARQAGTMEIVAAAAADNNLKTQATHQVLVQRAELKIEATGSDYQFAGTVGTYQVRIANTGNAVAKGVQATVRLPQGVRYLQGLENAKQQKDTLVWQLGDLPPAMDRTYRFDCELATDGDMQFRFTAVSSEGLEQTGDVVTRVEAIADLKLAVNDPQGPIRVGADVTYEVQITNRGSKAAAQVSVVAQFSEGIEPTATDGMPAQIAPGQVTFEPIAQIKPNETMKLKVTARADKDGNHVFRAAVQCADPETRLVAEDTTRFYGASGAKRTEASSLTAPAPQPAVPQVGTAPGWRALTNPKK
jgi:uncharacterized repeat protein (TIGR01451 family)